MTHACELENLSSEILEDGGNVDGGLGANTHLVLGVCLEETLDTTAGELKVVKVSDQVITGRDSEWTDAARHVKPIVEIDAVCAIRRTAVVGSRCDAKSAGDVPEKSDRAMNSRVVGACSVQQRAHVACVPMKSA